MYLLELQTRKSMFCNPVSPVGAVLCTPRYESHAALAAVNTRCCGIEASPGTCTPTRWACGARGKPRGLKVRGVAVGRTGLDFFIYLF